MVYTICIWHRLIDETVKVVSSEFETLGNQKVLNSRSKPEYMEARLLTWGKKMMNNKVKKYPKHLYIYIYIFSARGCRGGCWKLNSSWLAKWRTPSGVLYDYEMSSRLKGNFLYNSYKMSHGSCVRKWKNNINLGWVLLRWGCLGGRTIK